VKRTNCLCLDVTTRWNTTYDMFDSSMTYRCVEPLGKWRC